LCKRNRPLSSNDFALNDFAFSLRFSSFAVPHHFASHHFVFFFAPLLLRVFAFKFILVTAFLRWLLAVKSFCLLAIAYRLFLFRPRCDLPAHPHINPRFELEKRPKFGNTSARFEVSTPNQLASVAKY